MMVKNFRLNDNCWPCDVENRMKADHVSKQMLSVIRWFMIVVVFASINHGKPRSPAFHLPFHISQSNQIGIKQVTWPLEVNIAEQNTAQMIGTVWIHLGQKGQQGNNDLSIADKFGFYRQNKHEQYGGLRIEQTKHNDQRQQTGHHAQEG